ncbi:MAG: iron ABC transporter permease [Chloroflexi bacterium]|nr:iron ABC transporter permease [Chloroflexota bacterium]MYF78849.1 iron ABC transporter permease [Chloroflexota bacterium]MYK62435.1 iron ABC transporter permease [Chloroflexota bacterium]
MTRSTAEVAIRPALRPRRAVRRGARGAPVWVVIAAGSVVIAAMLPVVYLFIRGIDGGETTWDFLTRPQSMKVIWRTVTVIFTVTLFSLIVAVPAAWLTMRTNMPFRRVLAVALALPLVVPSFVMATTLIEALGPKGSLQELLEPFGVERMPSIYGLAGATLVLVLMTYPYVYLTVRATIAGLNPELAEASRSMGYTVLGAFRRVTLPLLMPAIGSGSILAALYTLSDFGGVALMRHNTLTVSIMTNYQTSIDRTAGAAMSMMLVVFAVALLFIESTIRGRRRYDDASGNVGRTQREIRLGWWTLPALVFVLLPIIAGVVVPVAVLVEWLLRGFAKGLEGAPIVTPLWNSLQASGLAAIATVLMALPVAFVTVRYRSWFSDLFGKAAYIGFGLPGVVVALSLVFFAVNFALVAYQTLLLLVFAYAVLFLPVALGSLRSGLMQINPGLEEAAQSLGKTQLQSFVRVTLPIMMPSIFASAAMVFLLTMKELPATLILGPTGFDTLATSIWSASSEAFFTQTAASSLILVAAAGVPTAWLVLREHSRSR